MKPRLFHGSAHEVTALKVHENETADKKERREFVFAMPNEVTAAAYALKNAAVCGTSHDDWCYLLVSQDVRVAPGRRVDWMAELPKSARGAGGFVYEVPADSFSRKGSGEWVSTEDVAPIKRDFVTVEDAMQKGVQIFILAENIKYSREMCEEWGRKPHALISAGLKDRSVQWLNRDKGINPIPPPTP